MFMIEKISSFLKKKENMKIKIKGNKDAIPLNPASIHIRDCVYLDIFN